MSPVTRHYLLSWLSFGILSMSVFGLVWLAVGGSVEWAFGAIGVCLALVLTGVTIIVKEGGSGK